MKVTPLFPQDDNARERSALYYLDLPDDHPEKRAFLNECVLNPIRMREWEEAQRWVQVGKKLSSPEPSVSIRARVLEMAYAESHKPKAASKKETSPYSWSLPGWRGAWAALFLVLSWGVYLQVEGNAASPTERLDQVEYELVSLEQELDQINQTFETDDTTL